MKTLFLSTLITLFLVTSLFSQKTPKTPSTPLKVTTTTKGASYSITFDTDNKKENSSVSIKKNNNIYKFTARFHESKSGTIKKLLIDKLGNPNLSVADDTYRWIKTNNGNKLYDCKLTEDTLKIYVDKEFSTSNITEMMDEFGEVLKEVISGTDSKEEAKRIAKSELESAEKELARAKRELEKVKRRLERNN
tara:strand:+ start:2392 stop:2967 length:576 start_codon:yes stop_codon:yes gene_type:complete